MLSKVHKQIAQLMRFISRTVLYCLAIVFSASISYAAPTITAATPNDITVEPGATIPVTVTVQYGPGSGSRWRSTGWRISTGDSGGFSCRNTPNYNGNGTANEDFNVTAPTAAGTYSLYFQAYTDDGCDDDPSNIFNAGTVIIPLTSVVSINRAVANPSAAASVSWSVVFNRAVTGVNAADFVLVNGGLGGTPAITDVTGSGTTYTVTASTGNGNGTLGLNLVDDDSIRDTSGSTNRLGGTGNSNGNFTGEVYTIDKGAPAIVNADGICGANQVIVNFSRQLNPASAQTAANYTISGGITVASATLLSEGNAVRLQTSAMPAGTYTLTVSNVRDADLNPIVPGSQAGFMVAGGTLVQGIRGLYYGQNGVSGAFFTGTPVQRIDNNIDFSWGNGIPVAGIAADNFSVRWTGYVRPPATGSYVLRTNSDDGVRLYLNGQSLIDNWTDHGPTNDDSAPVTLTVNQFYPLQMDFYERGGGAEAHLLGSYAGGAFTPVPPAYLFYCSAPVVIATPGAFNAFENSTQAGQTSGVIKTKVAGTQFNLDVVALDTSDPRAIQSNFVEDVKVELLGNTSPNIAVDPSSNCPQTSNILSTATVSFVSGDAGRKSNVAFAAVANAWPNVRVRISYPATGTATVVSCSTDNFAIRPASLGNIAATDTNWSTAGTSRALTNTVVNGGTVHKAGAPFTLTVSAFNSSAVITTNYAGSPAADVSACDNSGLISGCTASFGALTTGTWVPGSVPGSVTSMTASYSEVGSFGMRLRDTSFSNVDLNDGSTEAERYIPYTNIVNVGRFVPDHFSVAVKAGNIPRFKTFNDVTCAVRSFTYIGQPFGYLTYPEAVITARNAAGIATGNYQGAWWKVAGVNVVQTYTPGPAVLDTTSTGVSTVTPSNDSSGTGTIAVDPADTLKFVRNATVPQVAFDANISLAISVQDTSESSGAISSSSTANFDGVGSGIEFDSGINFRYGQMKLANAHGFELLRLPLQLETQFWNGTRFVTNANDSCTSLAAVNISLGNYKKNLTACETAVSLSGRFASGKANLSLSAPGAGNDGSVDLTVNLGANLLGNACVPPTNPTAATAGNLEYLQLESGTTFTADPTARATFGVRRSGPVIYIRELY